MKKKVRNRGGKCFRKKKKEERNGKSDVMQKGQTCRQKGTEDLYWCIAGGAKN
jgi:hypothetical protein